eukprot:CAMPEP_0117002236 /NCGR_PEP_ID=MMETSP0472-20121206/3982_1 /TAXON_ID=693140 ORGANISM="Tiarina fusus, Strain LIS" /NCGR_SAMPLE_ID=MMETSP0472 /ASSEMBLY_ACC=CAM_ASM_000603 /LENGTH=134 /DNA_ID=CAMNT_0004702535 /DNA_START=153 /DNA_END=557 /DNA_ORIENTATION=-
MRANFVIPKRPGKYEFTLPKTSKVATSFVGYFYSNVDVHADVSIDGKLTSSFGFFGFDIQHILPRGTHYGTIFLKKNRAVKEFYQENPGATVETHPDTIPRFEIVIRLSTLADDIEETQNHLDSLESSSMKQEL